MSHPIPATPRCAECCSRIDLNPSRLAAALWYAWLTFLCAAVLLAVSLPWVVLVSLCVAAVAPGIRCIRSFVLLRGDCAVRAIEWSDEGKLAVLVGPNLNRELASVGAGSFRLGVQWWVLRFDTPSGTRPVLIAGAVQDERAFRGLCRYLSLHRRRPSGRRSPPAVTIRPKV
jgi:hypothetical protein